MKIGCIHFYPQYLFKGRVTKTTALKGIKPPPLAEVRQSSFKKSGLGGCHASFIPFLYLKNRATVCLSHSEFVHFSGGRLEVPLLCSVPPSLLEDLWHPRGSRAEKNDTNSSRVCEVKQSCCAGDVLSGGVGAGRTVRDLQ